MVLWAARGLDAEQVENLMWLAAAGIGLIVAIAVIIGAFRWWKRSLETDEQEEFNLLTAFTEARDQGDITEEEYRRVRERLIERGRRAGVLPAALDSPRVTSARSSQSPTVADPPVIPPPPDPRLAEATDPDLPTLR